ncbi:hypothetical protein N9B57_05150 [Verrucomicrobia bacterium]|nr:hypothetical protein [Verrucomicrobiota bacterium]
MKIKKYHERSNPSAGVHISSIEATIVFVTVKTKKRHPWLAQDTVHSLLRDSWSNATNWLVGSYLLMPDHLHLFCAP